MIARIEAAGEIAMVRVDGTVHASGITLPHNYNTWLTRVLTTVGPDRQRRHPGFRRLVEIPVHIIPQDKEEIIEVGMKSRRTSIHLQRPHMYGLWTAQIVSIDPVEGEQEKIASLRLNNFQRIPQ